MKCTPVKKYTYHTKSKGQEIHISHYVNSSGHKITAEYFYPANDLDTISEYFGKVRVVEVEADTFEEIENGYHNVITLEEYRKNLKTLKNLPQLVVRLTVIKTKCRYLITEENPLSTLQDLKVKCAEILKRNKEKDRERGFKYRAEQKEKYTAIPRCGRMNKPSKKIKKSAAKTRIIAAEKMRIYRNNKKIKETLETKV